MKRSSYTHQFVEFIPESIEEGVLYVSVEYATTSHLCVCGCGSKIVAPLTPYDWRMSYDGETVSLWPSIGNWSFPCRSHYFLRDGCVDWARTWTDEEIAFGRSVDTQPTRHHLDRDAWPQSAGMPDRRVKLRGVRSLSYGRLLRRAVRADADVEIRGTSRANGVDDDESASQ